jgi:hypothetical protein
MDRFSLFASGATLLSAAKLNNVATKRRVCFHASDVCSLFTLGEYSSSARKRPISAARKGAPFFSPPYYGQRNFVRRAPLHDINEAMCIDYFTFDYSPCLRSGLLGLSSPLG